MNRSDLSSLAHVPGASAGQPARLRLPLLVMLSGTLLVVVDFFIVNVALPSIRQELHADASTLQWVVAGYALATAAGLITGGRLGDLFGRPRMFMLGLLLFTLASLGCGMAPTASLLLAARVAQGAAGALLQPQVLAMLSIAYTGPARAKAFAAYGLTLGLGATAGQLLGGALIAVDWGGLGWRTCFLINLPVGIAALAAAPKALAHLAGSRRSSRLDLSGAFLVAIAAVGIVWPLVEGRAAGWPAWTIATLVAALLLLPLVRWQQAARERRGLDALLPVALLTNRGFTAGLATVLAFYAGNAALYFVLALYLQEGLQLTPLRAGGVFTALALGFFITSMAAPRLAARFGGAPIARGALLLAAAHLLQMANIRLWPSHFLLPGLPLLALQGAALGIVMAPLSSAVLARVPAQHAGAASGVLATLQQVGNALGVALVGVVFFRGRATGAVDATAFAHSLVYLAATAVLTAWLYRRVLRARTASA